VNRTPRLITPRAGRRRNLAVPSRSSCSTSRWSTTLPGRVGDGLCEEPAPTANRSTWAAAPSRTPGSVNPMDQPVLILHSFRYLGLATLVPGVVPADLPAASARPEADGDYPQKTPAGVRARRRADAPCARAGYARPSREQAGDAQGLTRYGSPLSISEREHILLGMGQGGSLSAIADASNARRRRSAAEVQANRGRQCYSAWGAHQRARAQARRSARQTATGWLLAVQEVSRRLEQLWSPQQIARRLPLR
jgi:hypothetical protein